MSTLTNTNIFIGRIMCEALDDHEGSVSIGRRLITIRFADGIVVNAEEEEVDVSIQPSQGTEWRLVQTRRKW